MSAEPCNGRGRAATGPGTRRQKPDIIHQIIDEMQDALPRRDPLADAKAYLARLVATLPNGADPSATDAALQRVDQSPSQGDLAKIVERPTVPDPTPAKRQTRPEACDREESQKDLLARLVASMPDETDAVDADLKKSVRHSITEIMTMQESLSALVSVMLEDGGEKSFALLEAMSACLQRMERSIESADNSTFAWNFA